MTEKLHALLDERASAVAFPLPDLASVRSAGRRRRRRHRATAAACGLVAAAAAAPLVGAVLPLGGGETAPDATREGAPARPAGDPLPAPSYATGSVIRALDGEPVVDAGNPITAYVATADGFVIVNDSGVVFHVDGSDLVEPIGNVDPRAPRLVTDPTSSLVGWVDPTGERPVVVVADPGAGSQQVLDLDTASTDARDRVAIYALDDETAYVRDRSGTAAVDVATGERRPLGEGDSSSDVVAARGGRIVFDTEAGLAVGTRLDRPDLVLGGEHSSLATFSPDGRYLSVDADVATVVDAATGEPVDLGLGEFSVGWRWLDDDSLLVLAAGDDDEIDVLECQVPAGGCTTAGVGVATLGELETGAFVLPVGIVTSG